MTNSSKDFFGTPVSKEEAAEGFGFANTEALDLYYRILKKPLEEQVRWIIAELVSLSTNRAVRNWSWIKDKPIEEQVEWMIAEVCNIKEHMRELGFKENWEKKFDEMERKREEQSNG